jgi:hypothetical protein
MLKDKLKKKDIIKKSQKTPTRANLGQHAKSTA